MEIERFNIDDKEMVALRFVFPASKLENFLHPRARVKSVGDEGCTGSAFPGDWWLVPYELVQDEPIGRRQKTSTPLADMWQKAKAADPKLSRAAFIRQHHNLKPTEATAIERGKAQLRRELKKSGRN